ncbi:MAG: TetR/AcrR family transcriptional regulator [Acidimicrobiales bacterium]|jgi:AcrR family transcriptional regulator
MKTATKGEARPRTATCDVVLPGTRSPRDPARSLPPGGHGLSREHVAEVQRDRLVDAIVQVVADKGYDGATVKAIVHQAGVGLNTFYEHFRSKEDLFLAAYDRGVPTLLESVYSAFEQGGADWEARVEAGISAFMTILSANPGFARFFTVEGTRAGPVVRDRIDEVFENSFAVFGAEGSLVESVNRDRLGMLPFVIGGIYTRVHLWVRSGRTDRLPELAPQLTQFVIAVFRSEAEHSKQSG